MGLTAKKRRYVSIFLAFLFGVIFTAVLFLPYPKEIAGGERYTVTWADGSASEESYADVLSYLVGITESGDILLQRDAVFGTYVSGNGMKTAVATLESGDLAPMLSMRPDLNRLECAALFHVYGGTLYFDTDDWFRFDGENFIYTEIGKAEKVFYTGGTLSAADLIPTEAETLIVGDLAEFSYRTIYGTTVRVEGKSRYIVENNAIIDTRLGGILTAGQPLATQIVVPDVAVAARGALLPCRGLVSLSLPFVGSGPVAAGESFYGELGHLFTEGDAYYVPSSLKEVRVRGGSLISFAFYHCNGLEEIDACGVDPALIERQAFDGLPSLKKLHTPRADISLAEIEKYTTYVADCGCTIYERKET